MADAPESLAQPHLYLVDGSSYIFALIIGCHH